MRQVIKHREIKLLKMIRRTAPVIPRVISENRPRDSLNNIKSAIKHEVFP